MAIKVSQAVIDEIKKKGMAASIAKAKSGEASEEFKEGARRFYPGKVDGSAAPSSKPKAKAAMPKAASNAAARKIDTSNADKMGEADAAGAQAGKDYEKRFNPFGAKPKGPSKLEQALARQKAPVGPTIVVPPGEGSAAKSKKNKNLFAAAAKK